jgi:type VII secretion protein EccB
MASTPTSKSQVQAYRFVLRRMESALVRKDAVMLHDPMRTHKRATVVGIIAGVAILLGFLIVGVLKPSASLPTDSTAIVIAQPSGQVYVLNQNPRQLIPVFNVTSARLLLLAMSSSGSGSSGGTPSAPNIPGPTVVSDSELAGVPMGRLTGIPDGPQALPNPATSAANWAVCDHIPTDPTQPGQGANNPPTSTVLVGQSNIGTDLTEGQALFVTNGNTEYLIYHTPTDLNQPNDSAVAAAIDPNDKAVTSALFRGSSPTPRKISGALLNAIPKQAEIQDPFRAQNIPTGGAGPAGLASFTVGQTFQVQNSNNTFDDYAVLPNGVEKVSQTVAQILEAKYGNSTSIPPVSQTTFSGLNVLGGDPLQVNSYPGTLPTAINASTDPTVCLGWTADTNPAAPAIHTRVAVGQNLNLPTDSSGKQITAVQLGQVGPSGIKVDSFAMDPKSLSLGLAVRAVTNAQAFKTGPITLITGRGVAYSIDTVTTAQGLGVANGDGTTPGPFGLYPGPASIISLLPVGAETLNTQNVQRTFDSVQVPQTAGQYTPVTTTTAG